MLSSGRSYVVRRQTVTPCPTIVIGAAILIRVPGDLLPALFASLVLAAVAIYIFASAQPLTKRNLSIYGAAVGAMGVNLWHTRRAARPHVPE